MTPAEKSKKKNSTDTALKLVLIGAPGSGKGTQARMLRERYGTPQDIFSDITALLDGD
jgi:hypothetical protein